MDALLIGGQALAFFLILHLAASYRAAFALGALAFIIQAVFYIPAHNSLGNSVPFGELLLMQQPLFFALLLAFRRRYVG